MKVSIVHAERRCAQHIALDVVSEFRRVAAEPPLPARLRPTERCEFTVPRGVVFAVVAGAPMKRYGTAPLLIELEAEEGETLTDNTVRAFQLDPATEYYTVKALADEQLARLPAPLLRAGSRQQYGLVSVAIVPARDVLIAIVPPDAPACPAGCIPVHDPQGARS